MSIVFSQILVFFWKEMDMASIAEKLTGILEEVFVALDLPRELARVQVSGQGQAAQFQCNGAFQAAKAARANPREIAQKVVDRLGDVSVFSKVEIGGPGFINIDVMDAFIAAHLRETAAVPEAAHVAQ